MANNWASDGTDVGHNFEGGSIQWLHDNRVVENAADPDTITIPSGTFRWEVGLDIDKSCIIKGATTCTYQGSPSTLTANNSTIIEDHTPRDGANTGVLKSVTLHNQSFRFSGITFRQTPAAFTDGVANGTTTYTSATARFTDNDEGYSITGTGFPAAPATLAKIITVVNATTVTTDIANSGSGSNLSFTVGARNTTATGNGGLRVQGDDYATPSFSIRVDNINFDLWRQGKDIWVQGCNWGVADHNIHKCLGATLSHLIWCGTVEEPGHKSWADFPWLGTNKFFFIEDCKMIGNGIAQTSATIDEKCGGRVVSRFNEWQNAHVASHGTSGAPQRGVRMAVQYHDKCNWTIVNGPGEMRSGSMIAHDNTYTGTKPNISQIYRTGSDRMLGAFDTGFGTCDGSSVYDQNAAADGVTPVAAGLQGAVLWPTGGADNHSNATVGTTATRTVTMKVNPGWTNNQWTNAGDPAYSIHDATKAQPHVGSIITGNTANTLTYNTYFGTDNPGLVVADNDQIEIRKCLTQMDQNGVGKGDLMSSVPLPLNQALGNTAAWPRNQVEAICMWNNTHTDGTYMGFNIGTTYNVVDGIHVKNFFTAQTPDIAPASVQSHYNAARNGQQYTTEFVYPHPLTSGSGAPSVIISLSGDLAFGNVNVGNNSQRTLTINNNGDDMMTFSAITIKDGGGNTITQFACNGTLGTVPAHGSTDILVTFTPTAQVTYTGTLTVVSDATSGTNTIAISGTGNTPGTVIWEIAPDVLTFGSVRRGEIVSFNVTFTNNGNTPGIITGLPADAGVLLNWTTRTIQPGASDTLVVTADTSVAGTFSGTIVVTSNRTSGDNHIDFTVTVTQRRIHIPFRKR